MNKLPITMASVVAVIVCNWIYNSQCNQCISPQTLSVRIPLRQGALDTP